MSINFTPSLVEAMDASYTEDTFVRTLGFFAPGDGGAAVYRVTGNVSTPITNKAIQYTDFTLYCSDGEFHLAPDANHPTRSVFEIIPQGNTVYVEQFGVMPGDVSYAGTNITMLKEAVSFSASKGLVLQLGSKGIYYLAPNTISVPSNFIFEGNGGTLQIYGESKSWVGLFDSQASVDNVTIKNVRLVGRKSSVTTGYSDQAIHVKATDLVVENVQFEFFDHAVHTYGKAADFSYDIPEIQNKNWLISNCVIKDCIFGIMCSEIDGMTVTNSDISGFLDSSDLAHCIYLSCNCLNIRVNGCALHDISGDAIHKAYPATESVKRGDVSKNHFYNDLSINNVDSALLFGVISENVMCDNVFATYAKIALQLAGADNCIVSNSHIEQTQTSGERLAFIHAAGACNCWLQNSYVYHIGEQRDCNYSTQDDYIETMFANKKHRRMFIGEDFKTPNHWFKFTGCDLVSDSGIIDYYFYEVTHKNPYFPASAQFGEYLDNCSYIAKSGSEVFRLLAVNDLFGGITYRNCYMKNIVKAGQPPFRMWCNYPALTDELPCESNTCPVNQTYGCAIYKSGKKYPWVRFENNIFDNFVYGSSTVTWSLLLKGGRPPYDTHNKPLDEKVPNYLNAYMCNSYKLSSNSFQKLTNLMKS